uniref:Transmembrane epididymal protein 1 n=1 Tax=Sus scrofa TaxID=9823 RepID=A0A286ZSZ8_PIG
MGTLLGHLVPGLAIYFVGLYYAVTVSQALLRGQKLLFLPLPPRNKQGQRWWPRVRVEGIVKMAAGVTLILGEFFPPGTNRFALMDWEDPRRPFQNHSSWQHATIFGFFLFSALVDLTSQVWLAQQSMKLERAATALALLVTLLEMIAHLEHKNALEIRVHALLLLPVFLLALVFIIEVWVPGQPPLWVLKAWLTLWSGSWMLQMTSILYAPLSGQPWRADSPSDLAFVTTFFCWHLGLGAVVLAAIYGLCSLCHHRRSSWVGFPAAKYQPCPIGDRSGELEDDTAVSWDPQCVLLSQKPCSLSPNKPASS